MFNKTNINLSFSSINYCVRWESDTTVTKDQRDQINSAVGAQWAKWFEWTTGYDNFPYSNISVQVVGWAVKDASLLEGDTSDITVYTDTDVDGIVQCAEACGRYFHVDGDYSGCEAGEAGHYDQSLWLTDDIEGGTGGDWGQRISSDYMLGALGSDNIHILLHEMVSSTTYISQLLNHQPARDLTAGFHAYHFYDLTGPHYGSRRLLRLDAYGPDLVHHARRLGLRDDRL